MFFDLFLLVIGLLLLVKGGDWTIDGAANLARFLGVSPLLIGFTVVAFGTSLPELLVSVRAAFGGSHGISLGNVVGSNIANIFLVLGCAALVYPLRCKREAVLPDLMMMGMSTVGLMVLMFFGLIPTEAGVVMIVILVVYVAAQYWVQSSNEKTEEDVEFHRLNSPKQAIKFALIGLVLVSLGAEFLVKGAVGLAELLGVPEAIIGLTIVAVGTSLPELSTSIASAWKKQTEIIIGNVIGSNVFNILFILGITSTIKPLVVDPGFLDVDILMLAGSALMVTVALLKKQRITRPIGALFLLIYVLYNVYLFA